LAEKVYGDAYGSGIIKIMIQREVENVLMDKRLLCGYASYGSRVNGNDLPL
jgi:hypothetical protein